MAKCEDYPCCGHGPAGDGGACPDKSGRFPCVECGARLPKSATSSICGKCQKRMARRDLNGDLDYDYSMNY